MTLDDLEKIYGAAYWTRPELEPDGARRAGIAAVIRALRGVIDQAYSEGRASKVRGDNENVQRQWVDALINEILGDAGEKVAEMSQTIEQAKIQVRQLTGITKSQRPDVQFEPATDPAPVTIKETIAGTVLRMEQGYTGGMNDLSVTPATAPAPAVCEWTCVAEGAEYDIYVVGCDSESFSAWRRPERCPSCGKPIKFTEAKP